MDKGVSFVFAEDKNRKMHRIYDKFKSDNFTILSLSVDDAPGVVQQFRKKKWQMPWLNAHFEEGWKQPSSDF